MSTSVASVFNCMSGNSGLTEEFIYTKFATEGTPFQVLSGATDSMDELGSIPICMLNNGRILKVFEKKHGILVVRKGNAGQMTYLKPGNYTINEDAYILSLHDDFKKTKKIMSSDDEKNFLLWFIRSFQLNVYEFASKSDNGTWNKSAFLTMTINIPKTKEIAEVAQLYDDCLNIKHRAHRILKQIAQLKAKSINTTKVISKREITINQILAYVSRNDSLSEEGIYHHLPDKYDKEPIQVLSGSSGNMFYGRVNSTFSGIHILNKKSGLHVVSRGYAGKITFLPVGRYATNTNAFIFYLLPELMSEAGISTAEQKNIYLKFLRIYLQPIFYGASSESDLSVFPLTDLMSKLQIPLFVYSERMKNMVAEYSIIDKYEEQLESLLDRLDGLLQKQIALSSENL